MNSAKIIKNKQLLLVFIFLFGFISLLVLGMWVTDPDKGKMSQSEINKLNEEEINRNFKIDSKSVLSYEEKWVAQSEKKFFKMKSENQKLKHNLSQLEGRLNQIEKERKESKNNKKVDVNFSQPILESMNQPLPPHGSPPPVDSQESGNKNNFINKKSYKKKDMGIMSISLEDPKKSKKNKKHISSYLPSGAFSKVALLSGLDAPTGGLAAKNPMPITMQILDNGNLPNKYKSRVKNCHVTGASYGDISSERAYIRLELLSCTLKDGTIIEAKLKGYVTGEDGKAGFRGRLVSKQGALIARAALAGTFSGLGSAVTQSYQKVATSGLGSVQTVDPQKVLQAGIAQGGATALHKIADFYIARANETYPIIEISAGRTGEIMLNGGTELGEKILNIGDEE